MSALIKMQKTKYLSGCFFGSLSVNLVFVSFIYFAYIMSMICILNEQVISVAIYSFDILFVFMLILL